MSDVFDAKDYMTVPEVATALGVSVKTLYRYKRDYPLFPEPVYFGDKTARYHRAEVEMFMVFMSNQHDATRHEHLADKYRQALATYENLTTEQRSMLSPETHEQIDKMVDYVSECDRISSEHIDVTREVKP